MKYCIKKKRTREIGSLLLNVPLDVGADFLVGKLLLSFFNLPIYFEYLIARKG